MDTSGLKAACVTKVVSDAHPYLGRAGGKSASLGNTGDRFDTRRGCIDLQIVTRALAGFFASIDL
jgi:hypothetical protein